MELELLTDRHPPIKKRYTLRQAVSNSFCRDEHYKRIEPLSCTTKTYLNYVLTAILAFRVVI